MTGSTLLNPYTETGDCKGRSNIILAHPEVPDALVLTATQGSGYDRSTQGILKSTGRSITGSIILNSEAYQKEKAACNFVATLEMLQLFELLIATQRTSPMAITVLDSWVKNHFKTYNAFIDLPDEKWKTVLGNKWMHLLQFVLLEE